MFIIKNILNIKKNIWELNLSNLYIKNLLSNRFSINNIYL
jgi:hypothetical protein